MSDGPHRSLPMKSAWKGLAMRADNANFSQEDVSDAMHRAVRGDFRNEVSAQQITALNRIFNSSQGSLPIPEMALQSLKEVEHLSRGSVFGTNLHMWAVHMAESGRMDRAALHEAVGNAALERVYGGVRHVTEHYLRKSSLGRADKVAGRLEGTAASLSSAQLGDHLLNPQPRGRRLNHADLDDGVPLLVH